MSYSWCVQSYLIVIFHVLHTVWTVPHHYCLAPFNHSDCKLPPRPVFSYYKPGSRCEIEMWRGCPTLNKFENEYACAQNCIFRNTSAVSRAEMDECSLKLNTEMCDNETHTVYTNVDGQCIEAEWGGCETHNKFDSEQECIEKCHTILHEDLNLGSSEESKLMQGISDLLEYIIEKVKGMTGPKDATTTDATTTDETSTSTDDTPAVDTSTDETPAYDTSTDDTYIDDTTTDATNVDDYTTDATMLDDTGSAELT